MEGAGRRFPAAPNSGWVSARGKIRCCAQDGADARSSHAQERQK
jgi:hypothetical protein